MMTISQLLTPVTTDQAVESITETLLSLGIPADQWRAGGVASTIRKAVATLYAGLTVTLVQAIGAGFLETAAGGWLILLAHFVYGVDAFPATFASGNLTLTNAGGGIYTFAAGAASFQSSTTKAVFTNLSAFTLGASTSLSIAVQAVASGTGSNAPPTTIDTIVTAMLGVTCSNPLSIVGQNAESDPDLRTRCQNKLGALSVRGPRTAYLYAISVAVSPTTGARVNVNRSQVSTSSSTGQVTIWCASPSGAPTADDLAGVVNSVEAIARPDCVTVTVSAVTTVPYTPTLTVWAQGSAAPGLVAGDLQTMVATALTTFLSAYPVGGLSTATARGLFASAIDGVCKGAHASIFAVDGATDLALVDGQVATDAITVNVRIV